MSVAPHRRHRAFGLLLGVLAFACHASPIEPVVPAPIADQGYRLVQDWSFGRTVSDLDQLRAQFHTRYIYENGTLDKLKGEWQRYRDHDNHEFRDGRFALVARAPNALQNGQIESGLLRSRWSGRYGYIEGRIKVPPGRGLWPALWLNPQDQVWPPEIDIVEIVNNGRDTTASSFHFVHPGDGKGQPAQSSRLDKFGAYRPGFDYAADFHTFAVLWEPGRVRHFVDEQLVVDRAFEWTHKGGADAGAAHLLVNLAVGGDWPGAPARLEDFPARLEIDYLRVWQK